MVDLILGAILVSVFYALPAWLVWTDSRVTGDSRAVWVTAIALFSWIGYVGFAIMVKPSE